MERNFSLLDLKLIFFVSFIKLLVGLELGFNINIMGDIGVFWLKMDSKLMMGGLIYFFFIYLVIYFFIVL